MKLRRKAPCKECPFKKTSVKGWLGPWTANEIMAHVHGEAGFACHMSAGAILEKDEDISDEDLHKKVHVCVGSLLHANKCAKRYRPGNELREMQDKVDGQPTYNILTYHEFKQHHAEPVYD